MHLTDKIYIAGHTWLVWSALVRQLHHLWYTRLVYRTSAQLDLRVADAVAEFMEWEKPDYVIVAAAKVWGIMANNSYPAEFIYDNLQIQNNLIHHSYLHKVKKLLFLWSSCVYPKVCPQPIQESYLLTWPLEPSNEPYAIAKIAGIKMCQSYNRQYGTSFIACMPTNLYGPWDNFDLVTSHVLPAMIRKFHEAKKVWADDVQCRGDGSPMREFLYVDDMADACIHMMLHYDPSQSDNESGQMFLNIGTGQDITILELAETIAQVVWYTGQISRDTRKPNGTMRKVLDVSQINSWWWTAHTSLIDGIRKSYDWYVSHQS